MSYVRRCQSFEHKQRLWGYSDMRVLVTGGAGFIGSHLSNLLSKSNYEVLAIDNLSDYYSKDLKKLRVEKLLTSSGVKFKIADLNDNKEIEAIFRSWKPKAVFHLGAQAGVRIPLERSQKYIDSNISGFLNIGRAAQLNDVAAVIYASSSSVYGDDSQIPYDERNSDLSPKSIYGVTKLTNEKMAKVLAGETGVNYRGLRFFTVYGPWGRPDMAYFRLAVAAAHGIPFTLFGDGTIERDFTYVSDVIEMVELLFRNLFTKPKGFTDVVNLGGGQPQSMNRLIEEIESQSGTKIVRKVTAENSVDAKKTMASTVYLESLIGKREFVNLPEGIGKFLEWTKHPKVSPNLTEWLNSSL